MYNEQSLSQAESDILQRNPAISLIAARDIYPQAEPGFLVLQIRNPLCNAILALQGAQVLGFQPHDSADLLWLSPNAVLETGKAVRGGIPLCLPWFGVNRLDPQKPKHGFARTSRWTLEQASSNADGSTQLTLAMRQFRLEPHPLFDYPFEATLQIECGRELTLTLSVRNCSSTTMPLSWALHSYHASSELEEASISGLDNTWYLDNTRQLQRYQQQEFPGFDGEFDRVYLDVGAEQVIHGSPGIRVSADNAPSAIVWNPGADLAASMADLGADMHRGFICLERGAAYDNEQTLAPEDTLRAQVTISCAKV